MQALRDSKLMLLRRRAATPLPAPNSYELQQWARAQRSAAIGDAMAKGLQALRSAIVSALTPAPKLPAPRPVALCTAPR